ncbi:MAG: NosD domain-containing protein [Thermoproteota archaeon]|nr:NosD domain-containing protein [Thermoproteota archaeon]
MRRKFLYSTMFAFLLFMSLNQFLVQLVEADGSWVWVRNAVTGAYGEAVVGTSDFIYIARKNSFHRYDPADNSWTALGDPPNPDSGDAFKTGTALAWDFGNYIYALYGAATGDSRRWFYRYSISSNSWEALANTPADQGEGDAITWVSTDNCIYATIGGEQRPTHLMRYDPSTNRWSDAPADPPAGMGDGASLVWTGDKFLYGLRGEFDEESPLCDFWRYSLVDAVWTVMADIPADACDGGIGGVGDGGSLLYVGYWMSNQTGYIYALSGNQAHPEAIPDNRTYRYTISLNGWESLADLPFGIGYYVGCRLAYANGHIYAWQGAPSTWTGGGDDLVKYELTPTPRTWTVDDDGPADFHTIQEAINVASSGDTIYVYNGTYYEHVVVNKTVSLIGENKHNTTINGNLAGTVMNVTASNVNITGFTIQNSGLTAPDSGILVHLSSGNNISDNFLKHNTVGILLVDSSNNILTGNAVSKNIKGIFLKDSGGNTLTGNNVLNNTSYGIVLSGSSNNRIFHNNFINNTYQVRLQDPPSFNNTWDDGYPSGGNYWSDYIDVDLCGGRGQNEIGSDGIGDASYDIDADNTDGYPLMGPISFFNACTWNEVTYYVDTVSNSTVSGFCFSRDDKRVSFNVTGPDSTVGFCRVTIPKKLLWVEDGWQVYLIWDHCIVSANHTIIPNENYTYICFTYNHSIKTVEIQGTYVIPEFPSFIILPLFMIATLLTVIVYRRVLLTLRGLHDGT